MSPVTPTPDEPPAYAPSISDALSEYGVPRHVHSHAIAAFAAWLGSWRGLGETAESLAAQASRETVRRG